MFVVMYDALLQLRRATVPSLYLQHASRLFGRTDGLSDILGLTANLDSRRPRAIFLILFHCIESDTSVTYYGTDGLDN